VLTVSQTRMPSVTVRDIPSVGVNPNRSRWHNRVRPVGRRGLRGLFRSLRYAYAAWTKLAGSLRVDPSALREIADGTFVSAGCPTCGRRGAALTPKASAARYPSAADVYAHWNTAKHTVERFGVPTMDSDDLAQDVLLVAMGAIRRGRYKPPSGQAPEHSLHNWIVGIAWHKARSYAGRARVRLAEHFSLVVRLDASPEPKFEARSALRAIHLLKRTDRE
jgi:hypothetical protein